MSIGVGFMAGEIRWVSPLEGGRPVSAGGMVYVATPCWQARMVGPDPVFGTAGEGLSAEAPFEWKMRE